MVKLHIITTDFEDGKWHFIVARRFILPNGHTRLDLSVDNSSHFTIESPINTVLRNVDISIGALQYDKTAGLRAVIDELRIYTRAISDGEIASHFGTS